MQLTVTLVLKEWQFSDGSVTLSNSLSNGSHSSFDVSPKLQSRTGRKLRVAVVEGKALAVNGKSGKCDPYVKVQYGKVCCYLAQSLASLTIIQVGILIPYSFYRLYTKQKHYLIQLDRFGMINSSLMRSLVVNISRSNAIVQIHLETKALAAQE